MNLMYQWQMPSEGEQAATLGQPSRPLADPRGQGTIGPVITTVPPQPSVILKGDVEELDIQDFSPQQEAVHPFKQADIPAVPVSSLGGQPTNILPYDGPGTGGQGTIVPPGGAGGGGGQGTIVPQGGAVSPGVVGGGGGQGTIVPPGVVGGGGGAPLTGGPQPEPFVAGTNPSHYPAYYEVPMELPPNVPYFKRTRGGQWVPVDARFLPILPRPLYPPLPPLYPRPPLYPYPYPPYTPHPPYPPFAYPRPPFYPGPRPLPPFFW